MGEPREDQCRAMNNDKISRVFNAIRAVAFMIFFNFMNPELLRST